MLALSFPHFLYLKIMKEVYIMDSYQLELSNLYHQLKSLKLQKYEIETKMQRISQQIISVEEDQAASYAQRSSTWNKLLYDALLVSPFVKAMRETLGFTQEQFSRKLGFSDYFILRIENLHLLPSVSQMHRIFDYLDNMRLAHDEYSWNDYIDDSLWLYYGDITPNYIRTDNFDSSTNMVELYCMSCHSYVQTPLACFSRNPNTVLCINCWIKSHEIPESYSVELSVDNAHALILHQRCGKITVKTLKDLKENNYKCAFCNRF